MRREGTGEDIDEGNKDEEGRSICEPVNTSELRPQQPRNKNTSQTTNYEEQLLGIYKEKNEDTGEDTIFMLQLAPGLKKLSSDQKYCA
jgi:hypothetical protein